MNKWLDNSEVHPWKGFSLSIIFFVIASAIVIYFLVLLSDYIDIDSAKLALSAQIQASATILSLVVAIAIFIWFKFQNEEESLKVETINHLSVIASSRTGPHQIIKTSEIMYFDYRTAIEKCMDDKGKLVASVTVYKTLGYLWIIKLLSYLYDPQLRITFGPYLKHSQIKELSDFSPKSKKYALEMWENFHVNQTEFFLNMFDAISVFHGHIVMLDFIMNGGKIADKYVPVGDVCALMRKSYYNLKANQLLKTRSYIKPRVYWPMAVLALSIVSGLAFLSIINGNISIPELHLCSAQTIVLFQVLITIFGLYLSILTISVILK